MFAQMPVPHLSIAQLRDLARRVDAGDEAAITEFRQHWNHPEMARRFGTDLPALIQCGLLSQFGLNRKSLALALTAKRRQLRDSLAATSESPILQLLAERVATCWLFVHVLETICAFCRHPELRKHYQQAIDSAHRRYLAALKTLADVRRLNLPAIQVNVAQQQVVVGGGVFPTGEMEDVRQALAAAAGINPAARTRKG